MSEVYSTIIALQVNLLVKRGDPAVFLLPLFDPNDGGNPYPLNQFDSFKMQVKSHENSDTFLFELTDKLTYSGTNNNILNISLSLTETGIKESEYVFDIVGIAASVANDRTIVEGKFTVDNDVTR